MSYTSPGRPSLLQLSEEARYPQFSNEGKFGRALGGALGAAAGAIAPPLLGYQAGAMAAEPFTGMWDAPPDAGGPGGAVLGTLGSYHGASLGGKLGAHLGDKAGDAIGGAAKWLGRKLTGRKAPSGPPQYEPVVRRLRDDERKPKQFEPSSLDPDDMPDLPPATLNPTKRPPKPLPYEVVPEDPNDALDLANPEFHEPEPMNGPDVYDRVHGKTDLRTKVGKNSSVAMGAYEDEIRKWHAAGDTPQAIALRLQDAGLDGTTVGGVERFLSGRGEELRPSGDLAMRANADKAIDHVLGVHGATRLSVAAQRELFKRELERAGHSVAFDDELNAHWRRARTRWSRRNRKAAPAETPADSPATAVEWINESVSHRRQRAGEWGV